jgi:CHASE2 domain-containing sensor protein
VKEHLLSMAARPRLLLMAGAVPVLLAVGAAFLRPALLAGLERTTYDRVVRWARTGPPGGGVAIVSIDERSLSAIGQWPWRRDVIGALVTRLREMHAAAVALDIVFAEPDRQDGAGGTDAAFAGALREGRAVLGYALTFDDRPAAPGGCVLHPLNAVVAQASADREASPFLAATGAICSLPELARAAGASGFLNAAPDQDGILRRVPLLLDFDGRVYPSLALAAVLAARGIPTVALQVANVNAATLDLGGERVPLGAKSHLLVRYRGRKGTFPYISASDVLEGRLPEDAFANKIVFVGATALGTREVVATPLDTLFAGVEVQATVADDLLQRTFIWRPVDAVTLEALAVLILGVAAVAAVARLGVAWGALWSVASVAAVWAGAARLVSVDGAYLSPLYPTLGVAGALAGVTLARYARERLRADRASREKTVSERLMVQTLLSLVEARDLETGRHARRTERYAQLLAHQLSFHPRFHAYLTPERVDLVARLAPLHDIGKVGVPDRVLNKPGALTTDELREVQKHPVCGRDVIIQAQRQVGVRDDAILAMAKEIVYTHHERWDGSGYPEGLRGEEIPIPGRLMALVDVYDALVSDRVYRKALSHDQAIGLIAEGSETYFDPAIVEAFLQVAPTLQTTASVLN